MPPICSGRCSRAASGQVVPKRAGPGFAASRQRPAAIQENHTIQSWVLWEVFKDILTARCISLITALGAIYKLLASQKQLDLERCNMIQIL